MIFMAVGKQIAADMIPFAHQVGDIRDDKVHPQHVFLRKNTAAVHDDDVVFVFKNIHVFADLINTAERHDPQSAGFLFLALRAHSEPPFVRTNIQMFHRTRWAYGCPPVFVKRCMKLILVYNISQILEMRYPLPIKMFSDFCFFPEPQKRPVPHMKKAAVPGSLKSLTLINSCY